MNAHELMALESIKGVGNKSLIKIVDFMQKEDLNTVLQIANYANSKFGPQNKFFLPKVHNILANDDLKDIIDKFKQKYSDLENDGITVVCYGETSYPQKLIQLDNPPALLYCRGNVSLLNRPETVAVVGTRESSERGEVVARRTVEFLSESGFVTVSGLALGIDKQAHISALRSGMETIAVLTDIEKIKPSSNTTLANEILQKGGLLVSENPPNSEIFPALFVKRDRIQAGLALAVFAIETSEDGGTMHAVKSAQSLGRLVYVPDAKSAGYPDLTAKEIMGTQLLVNSGVAVAYTKENYSEILHSLKEAIRNRTAIMKVDKLS